MIEASGRQSVCEVHWIKLADSDWGLVEEHCSASICCFDVVYLDVLTLFSTVEETCIKSMLPIMKSGNTQHSFCF